jgi:hypothetical protein
MMGMGVLAYMVDDQVKFFLCVRGVKDLVCR